MKGQKHKWNVTQTILNQTKSNSHTDQSAVPKKCKTVPRSQPMMNATWVLNQWRALSRKATG